MPLALAPDPSTAWRMLLPSIISDIRTDKVRITAAAAAAAANAGSSVGRCVY